MSIKSFAGNVRRGFNRVGLKLKKYGPTIGTGAGVVGVIVAAVMACRATKKTTQIAEDLKEDLDTIDQFAKDGEAYYPESVQRKDVFKAYLKAGAGYVKAYAPAVLLGGASIAAIIGSHGTMLKRNASLGTAYMAVDQAFKMYRKRVKEELGEETDTKFRYGLNTDEIEIEDTDEDGNTTIRREQKGSVDISQSSQYARFFDSASRYWCKDPTYNLSFLKHAESAANDQLIARGHVFLNEVYDMLDIPRTPEGAVVGWVYGNGDNEIDFGIFDFHDTAKRRFVNGYENVILLDFNVDGVIYDKI